MKNIFFIIFALGIIGFFCLHFVTDIGTVHATGWLGGYSYRKSLVVTSSSTAPGVNYVPTIKISPYSNPISTASSSWTVNGTTFHYRIAIPVTEDNGATLANYYVRMQVNTIWLNNNGYFRSGGAGDEAEFTNSAGTVLPYYYDTTLFNQASSTYWVKMSLGIGQSTTTYMYFDPNAATSTSYTPVSVTTNGYSSSTTVQVSATGDDMRYYTTTYASTTCATSTSYAWFDGGDDGLGYTGRSSARFLNVSIPRAATITSSSLTLVAYNAQSATTTRTYIHGEAADNAPQITTCSDFLNRTRTTASTEWDSIPSWTASSTYVSPDLSAPIQEIVNRSGWASGNTLQFFWENNSSNSSTVGAYRTAYSYYLSSTLAPKLYVGYSVATSTIYNFLVNATSTWLNQPIVNVPYLFSADVYLNGQSKNWPYDIAFTLSDGTTQLNYAVTRETEISATNQYIEFAPKITDNISANSSDTLYVYYGRQMSNAKSSYWSESSTYAFYDGITDSNGWSTSTWNNSGGSWGINPQQTPIFKGDTYTWTRNPLWQNINGTYYLYYLQSGSYSTNWRFPWTVGLATSTDLQHWTMDGQIFNDWGSTEEGLTTTGPPNGIYWGNFATDASGTLWVAYDILSTASTGDDAGIASSSDNIHFNKSSANPVYAPATDVGCSHTAFGYGLAFDGSSTWYLFYTAETQPACNTWSINYATYSGATPTGHFTYQGHIGPFGGTYNENFDIKKYGSTWYLFYSSSAFQPQRAGVAYASSLAGPWTDLGLITKTYYEYEKDLSGTPRVQLDSDGLYKMLYTAIPTNEADGNPCDGGAMNNFFGLATTTSVASNAWSSAFVTNMYNQSKLDGNLYISTTSATYGNVSVVNDMMIDWNTTATTSEIGTVWRYQDNNDYMSAGYDVINQKLIVRQVASGIATTLANVPLNFNFNLGGQIHRIRVQTYNSYDIVGYSANGEDWTTAYNATDTVLSNSSGSVGVYTKATNGFFENFAIAPYVPSVTFASASNPTLPPPPPTKYWFQGFFDWLGKFLFQ